MIDFASLRFEDYLKMFGRRKWYFGITTVVVTTVVTLVAWRLPHMYKSETTILVTAQGISEGYVKSTQSERLDDRLSVISFQLKSRSVLEHIIQDFKLYGYGTSSRYNLDDALKKMRENIEVNLGQHNTFTVAYYAPHAWLARDVTKRLADEVIGLQNSSRESQAVGADMFIDQQYRQAEKALAVQEEKLKLFKLTHLGSLPEQNAVNLAALNGLHNQLISNESALQRAQDQQLILEQRIQDQKNMNLLAQGMVTRSVGRDGTSVTTTPNSRANLRAQLDAKRTQLAEQEAKYTDKFPDVVRLKREVQDLEQRLSREPVVDSADASSGKDTPSIPGARAGADSDLSAITAQLVVIKRDIANYQKEHEQILQQIQTYQARLNLTPKVEQELLTITRDTEALRQNYKNLQDKKFNSQVAANLEKSNLNDIFRVIEEAYLPEKPAKPNRRLIAIIGLISGICLGLGLIVTVEYLDPTLGNEDIATAELNLAVLVSIPEIKKNGASVRKSVGDSTRLLKPA